VAHDARATSDLPTLAALVEACLLAELPAGLHEVLDELAARTAQQHDALLLLQAVEPLARTYRYGDVRGGDPAAVARVLDVLVTRAALGLGSAVASIDDDRASEARTAIEAAHRGVSLAEISPLREQWYRALTAVAEQPLVHGAVQGRVVRLLLDAGELPIEAVRAHVSRNLSRAADARHGAAWLDGFLVGDVALLLHDANLLSAIDDWVTNVADDTFEDVLPLLRRAFARYEKPERRLLGDRLKRGQAIDRTELDLDAVRAAPAVAKVAALLGIDR
jgi:hypothetical protein